MRDKVAVGTKLLGVYHNSVAEAEVDVSQVAPAEVLAWLDKCCPRSMVSDGKNSVLVMVRAALALDGSAKATEFWSRETFVRPNVAIIAAEGMKQGFLGVEKIRSRLPGDTHPRTPQ